MKYNRATIQLKGDFMDKALLNERVVTAYEISLNYQEEKAIRISSRNKYLKCVDPHCKNPILRYCHGDKKQAYFAHLTNTDCDYDRFEKNDNEIFKELRISLSRQFLDLGYKVETEVKILDHHYSPLLCSNGNGSFVIEMGDSKTTLGYVEKLLKEYSLKDIDVKWIVLGEEMLLFKENGVSFLKRYLLNESKNNDFILVDKDKIIQYRLDKKKYQLNIGQEIYKEKADLKDLCVLDGELSIKGYNSRFIEWQNQKETEIAQTLLKGKERQELAEKHERERKARAEIQRSNQIIIENNPVADVSTNFTHSNDTQPNCEYTKRTYTCSQCGKKGGDSEFYFTQGNQGTCWECHYGPERYKEIKKHRGW